MLMNLLSKFKVEKKTFIKDFQPINEYIVILYERNGLGLKSESMTKEDLENLILKNRESIKYIFKYVDIVHITNELVEIN